MSSKDGFIGFSDADAATLAEVVHDIAKANEAISAAQARMTRALARGQQLAGRQTAGSPAIVRDREMAQRAVAAEVACEMRVSDRTVQRRMNDAAEIVEHYPATLHALEAGRINNGHLRLVVETGAILPPEKRPEFEAEALARCERDTPGRVRAGIEILAQRMHPRTLTERHVDARETRRVFLTPNVDGMSEVILVTPTILGEGIYDRVTRQATAIQDERKLARERLRTARAAGLPEDPDDVLVVSDERSIDQLRADILADMLLTAQPGCDPTAAGDGSGTLGAIRAHVQVIVPALSLLGADEHPADLAGRSPIDADTARRLAGGSCTGWDRVLTAPATGQVLATDRYQPPADLRRRLRARDPHCRFPGCRIPAIRCEHDHTVDHALGGETHLGNLEGLCQRHHSMKQFTAWKVKQLHGGVIEWTSPLGRTYTDDPPAPTVHFVPDDEPPPRESAADPPPAGAARFGPAEDSPPHTSHSVASHSGAARPSAPHSGGSRSGEFHLGWSGTGAPERIEGHVGGSDLSRTSLGTESPPPF